MIENNNEPNFRIEFPSLYDVYNSIIVKSGGLEEFQKEIIKQDPSLDGLFKDNGYPVDLYREIDKRDIQHSGLYVSWMKFWLALYSYHFQSQRMKDLLSQTSELKNSLTAIDSKLNEMQGTLDTLEDDIKVNTAAIATLDEDFKDKMKHSVAYIVKNDDDNTDKILKAIP